MDKQSSCIAIFSNQSEANKALQQLVETRIDKKNILLLDKDFKQGSSVGDIHQFFKRIGVPEDTTHCYLCLLKGGSLLLIVSGNYQDIEFAYEQLDKNTAATPSIHFNNKSESTDDNT